MGVRLRFSESRMTAFGMRVRTVGVLVSGVLAASAFTAPAAEADEYPTRYAGWSMDEAEGPVAHAVADGSVANPRADLRFTRGVEFGQAGNSGNADRSVRLNGRNDFGRARFLASTSRPFMFSTWVKLASLDGDQIAVSQGMADGSVFELGWIGDRWTFRHRTVHGDTVASVTRDMAQAADGTPWTEHWVSLMGGYDPIAGEVWLRTQADGEFEKCVPDEPWNCYSESLMPPETEVAPTGWTTSPGKGPLLFGATADGSKRHSFWNGWLDDSQLWPLTHTDQPLLRVIYGETVPAPHTSLMT